MKHVLARSTIVPRFSRALGCLPCVLGRPPVHFYRVLSRLLLAFPLFVPIVLPRQVSDAVLAFHVLRVALLVLLLLRHGNHEPGGYIERLASRTLQIGHERGGGGDTAEMEDKTGDEGGCEGYVCGRGDKPIRRLSAYDLLTEGGWGKTRSVED